MEYAFCQTDTFPELNQQVRDAGGVCSVCAIDWVLGKLKGQPFIFSAATVSEKSRQFKHQPTFHEVYADAIPTMQLGHTTKVDINATGGSAIASATAANKMVLLQLGDGLSRIRAGLAHTLALCQIGGKFHMFDSNFGSFECSFQKGVAAWFVNVMTCVRHRPDGPKVYTDWASEVHIIPFN